LAITLNTKQLEMWANAHRDGRRMVLCLWWNTY